jgi:hypothetical protein
MPSHPITYLYPTLSSIRPSTQLYKNSSIQFSVIRNQLSISSWLALGAFFQCILLMLPIRNYLIALPTISLLLYRITLTALQSYGYLDNPYANGILPGNTTVVFPTDGSSELKPGNSKICVVILGAKSNHPLGIFAPTMGKVGQHFQALTEELEANAADWGYLGGSTSINASDGRATSNQLVNIMYFRSKEHVSRFAHGRAHMKTWMWWHEMEKKEKEQRAKGSKAHGFDWVSVNHEIYEAEGGAWEVSYLNTAPTGLAATSYPVETEDKNGKSVSWGSAVVQAVRSLKTSKGRMGVPN